MTDLSGAGVRVLLIATATHEGALLTSVPAVATSCQDLRTALIERCGVRPDHLRPLLDPADAQTMARAVTEEAQRAETVLLVYFIGHGLLGPDGELYLAATSTDRLTPGMAEHQALSFSSLRQALEASRASSVVVVLDCCFSGRVSLSGSPSLPAFTMTPAHGMYLMGSAEQLALAPPHAVHTAFTGALIELLTHGDPRGLQPLTLDAVFDGVFRAMSDRQGPLPRRQAGDRSGHLVIAPNSAVPTQAGPPEEAEPAPGRCPYLGLDAFGVDDADVFFGRDGMTERVFAALTEVAATDEPGPLVLVGPSGSGKTSLLSSGLMAGLRERGLLGTTSWLSLRLTPGRSPLRRLAARFDTSPESVDLIREDPDRAAELAERLLAGRPEQRLIVVVDQLEELFTLCTDPSERTAFLRAVTALARLSGGCRPGALVVLALRADFYGQAAAHPELLAALCDTQLLVEPMTADELHAAIEGPAAAGGLVLDEGLADVILHEFGATADRQPAAGALPLLSHVLWATWLRRAGSRLTVAQYRAAGGIAEAIKTTADDTYDGLDLQGREAVRLMLPRLVRVGEDSADTAQPVDRSALLHGLPDTAAAQRAIDQFTEARLLTLDHDSARISHETLLRAWPRLTEWVDADRDWLRARQQLAADARAWEKAGRESSLLYRGSRLVAVRERAESSPVSAVEPESELAKFVDASWHQERRGVRRVRIAVAFLVALVVLATSGLIGSVAFQRRAERAGERDLARYLAAESEDLRDQQPGLAKQLSLVSYRMNKDAGRGALLNSRRTPGVINAEEPAQDLAYSGDGRILAISVLDRIELRFPGGSARVGAGVIGPVTISRDGQTLAAVTYDKRRPKTARVQLWDISDPAHPRQTAAPQLDHAVHALALSTNGKTLYGGLTTGEIRVWDIGDQAAPRPLPTLRAHSARIDSLAVSPQRDLLASMSDDGRIQLWKAADSGRPERVAMLKGASYGRSILINPRPLHRVAFNPTGRMLAAPLAVKNGDKLGLWELDAPDKPRKMEKKKDDSTIDTSTSCYEGLNSLAFNPTRDYVAGTCGSTWRVWIYQKTLVPGALLSGASGGGQGSGDEVGMVLFDPAKPRRLLQATDHGVRVFYINNSAQPGAEAFLPATPGTGGQFDYRLAGKRQLIALQGVGLNYLWDVTEMPDSATLLAATRSPDMFTGGDIALSPDGRLLADVEVYEGSRVDKKGKKQEKVGLRLRSTSAPRRSAPLATIDELDNGVAAIAFSPTEPVLAVSDMNGFRDNNHKTPVVRLYDIANPKRPRQIARIHAATTKLDFSPDGKSLLLTNSPFADPDDPQPQPAQKLESWDLTNPAQPEEQWARPVETGIDSVHVAFRPDGKLLAVYDNGGTLRLWRVEGHRLTEELSRVTVGVHGGTIAFSPDGTHLALTATKTILADERPEIWDLTDPKYPRRYSYLPSSSRAADFYALQFSPDGEFLAIVRASAGVEIWDTNPERVIADLCDSAGDPISGQEWKHYLPDKPYEPPCRPS
ncbi:AAA family ATPase [Streptomyces sp. NBC_01285]|uniref:caspase, EACC1-associated type n=1 Tax=Streptomyces sp. NBC_01285 TaxID=2903813 RepID=UPI00224EBC1A|nr:AAA family ATPase [Streptomyces sp. NBC_01285]MCX4774985.1 caspase family protein [Streptomyces sp. NBC_01285]